MATALRNQVILVYRNLLNAQRVLFAQGKLSKLTNECKKKK